LSQNFSSAISEFSSLDRFCNVATSKKPPQVREFLGGGHQLRGDQFEHGGKIQELEPGIQNGKSRSFCNGLNTEFLTRSNAGIWPARSGWRRRAKLICPALVAPEQRDGGRTRGFASVVSSHNVTG
jgi:hypothetical protein